MISYLKRIISLNNLRSRRPGGQIATLLMLLMVGMLIFILVTVNIGQISVATTNLSNAADAASLSLSSQLATKSRMLVEALGGTKKCQKRGLGGIIGGIIAAILVIVVPPLGVILSSVLSTALGAVGLGALAGSMTVLGASAGAIGGAIGGAIAGPGAGIGALQGAMVGVAIGGGVELMGKVMTPVGPGSTTTVSGVAGPQGATVGLVDAAQAPTFVAAGQPVAAGSAIYSGSAMVPVVVPLSLGGIAGMSLSAASSIYPEYVQQKMTSAALSKAAKALSGLAEAERIRESVFLQALSQTVDDPNMHIDEFDSDDDGDIQEKVPYFQWWWERRVDNFRHNTAELKKIIAAFFNGPLRSFRDFAETQYSQRGPLCRQELDGSDGSIILLARGLENAGYDMSFWKPGALPLRDPNCEECEYYDGVDRAVSELKEIVEAADSWGQKSLEQLADQWQDWLGLFYDPTSDAAYHTTLRELVDGFSNFKGLTNWKEEIKTKQLIIPECVLGPCLDDATGLKEVCNPPCRIDSDAEHPYPGTIDEKKDDEFDPAIQSIDNMITQIAKFRAELRSVYISLKQTASQPGNAAAFGGKNPVTYSWKDSRGEHSVTAETQFALPYLKKKKSSKKVCLVVMNASGTPLVRIIRQDPQDTQVGILGIWNPFGAGSRITRASRGSYSYNRVGLADIR